MVDINKSSYVQAGVYAPDDHELSGAKFYGRVGSGKFSGRTFGIGAFLNNYQLSVEQMAAIDPLPRLIPLKPFLHSQSDEDTSLPTTKERQVEKWPCGFKEIKRTTQDRFPRRRDWMHDWAHYMYRIGEYGAKTQK